VAGAEGPVAVKALAIDHVFLFVQPDGPELDALRRLGLTETYRRAHPGQGTANVCFAFDNLFLELLWLTNAAEARNPAIARTRLWERSQWRKQGACPFGIAVRGQLAGAGLPTWDYRPPYLPEGLSIPVATASDDPALPMVFISPGTEGPVDWPEARRGQLQWPAGFGPVLAVEVGLPAHPGSGSLLFALATTHPSVRFTPRPDGQYLLRLALAGAKGRQSHILDLESSSTGPWRVSLVEEGLPACPAWQRA
jgi:hypothetical protein